MKKLLSLFGVGFLGISALQGCAASVSSDEAESQAKSEEAVNACYTNNGLNPTKAALAVAMADELGRWDPAHDLVKTYSNTVQLSPSAVCKKNNCANTKALLGQQDQRLINVVDQNVFNPAVYASDLVASMDRGYNFLSDIQRNSPWKLPPAHKLTRVGGPVNLGTGACGPHYVYQADRPDGSPLSSTEAANLGNGMCFYGFANCGNGNPYLKYTVTGQGCPWGRTCVAVDPTDGDNGSGTTTTAGSAPVYPLNRLYDPSNSVLGSACVTTANRYGSMVSKCSTIPTTCGYLYCVAY